MSTPAGKTRVLSRLSMVKDAAGADYGHLRVLSPSKRFYALAASDGPYDRIGWPRSLRALDGQEVTSLAFEPQDLSAASDCNNLKRKYSGDAEASSYLASINWGLWLPLTLHRELCGYVVLHKCNSSFRATDIEAVRAITNDEAWCTEIWHEGWFAFRERTDGAVTQAVTEAFSKEGRADGCEILANAAAKVWGAQCTVYVGILESPAGVRIAAVAGAQHAEALRGIMRFPADTGVFGFALREGVLLSNDLAAETRFRHNSMVPSLSTAKSAIACRVDSIVERRVVVSVESNISNFFDVDDEYSLVQLSHVAAAAINGRAAERKQFVAEMADTLTRHSHAIVHPVQGIINDVEAMMEELDHPLLRQLMTRVEFPRRLGSILSQAKHIGTETHRRIKEGRKASTKGRQSIENVLAAVVREFEATARSKALSLAVDLHAVRYILSAVDDQCLAAALRPLISNAIKYSSLKADTHPPHVIIDASIEMGSVVVAVSNFGVGIEPEEIGLVMERYHRGRLAQRSGEDGTGLGLPEAVEAAAQFRGTVRLESRYCGRSSDYPYGVWETTATLSVPLDSPPRTPE